MKLPHSPARPWSRARGFTLIEISLVIGLMLGLMTLGGLSYTMVRDWNKGKNASLALQAVYSAQRSYMADNPTADIGEVDVATLESYLPTGWTTMPTMKDLQENTLSLDFTVMPPVFLSGTTPYDPSQSTKDGLWDIGS